MTKLFVCACLALTIWHAAPVAAMTIIGSGTESCGSWTTYRREKQAEPMEQWALGFASGAGWSNTDYDALNDLDANAVWGWIDNYCSANPLKRVIDAVEEFMRGHPH